ncbi:hypothetical protein LPW11_12770 [Geomonas sp. RF6]|uniref:hypothetical protein n=1 Tax=Geomonas sp. RF6 TaxID=2897342 RepID=UPI001E4E0528|nr:hypothetical protein [Geomonas sp. RF6]UFS68773.1 hypothetical protein LPW11_12770 [Geomonas sp. RF6]
MRTINFIKGRRAPWQRLLLLGVLAASLFPSAGQAASGESEPPVAVVPAEPAPPPPPEPIVEPSFFRSITNGILLLGRSAEKTHDKLQASILEQTIRFDDFFGTMNNKKEQRTGYLLRWRNDVRLDEGGHLHYGSTLRADVRLSRIDEKLRLTFASENDSEAFAPRLPEDPGNPGFDRTTPNARIVNMELRYQLVNSLATTCFMGVGLDLSFPLQVFVRARYQHSFRLSDVSQIRVSETAFEKTADGLGETTEVSIERSLSPETQLRLATSGTASEEIGGFEWGSELSLLHRLSPKSAVTVAAGVYGDTSEAHGISNHRIFARYRRNFLRSWLFYEVEPEVFWPRRDDDTYPTSYAVTFRLEVLFEGKEEKK